MSIERKLLARIERLERQSARLRRAVVTDDSPLTVKVAGSDVEVAAQGALASYASPTVDDEVVCIQQGAALLVLGEIT